MAEYGTLYGIGVGPGDPDLLTLKAHRLLQSAPVVAYPAPDSGESFARAIVASHLPGGQEEIAIVVPMRVARFPAQEVYDEAAKTISARLEAGQDVVVLCEGDPFFYGSFMYLFERLADRFTCEVVPGISSLMASGAMSGRPLAARNDVLTVLPAPLDDDAIKAHLKNADALAFIKVGRHLPRLRGLLESAGLIDRAAYVERATLPHQKIMPLASFEDQVAPYFSMVLVYRGAEDWVAALEIAHQEGL